VRAAGGKTYEITPHPDYMVSVKAEELAEVKAEEPAEDLEAATEPQWLKNQCFKRDDYRCVMIGNVDRDQRKKLLHLHTTKCCT
jgi:hypothetical protein